MEFDGKITEITLELKVKRVIRLDFRGAHVSFKCQRCAVFCCKLGGPKLLSKDIERLNQAGYSQGAFLDAKQASLKSKEDGSCIFLSINPEGGSYHQCSVYDYRPTFCRLYPFKFEKLPPQSYALSFIPCCNGLNTQNGEVVDEKFFVKFLQEILFDLMDFHVI